MGRTTVKPVRMGRRGGYTMLELLLASMVTALVAGSSAAFLSAVTNASTTTRDVRAAQNSGHYALMQVNQTLREARAIGQVTSSTITVWLGDYNKDDKLNLYETGIIRYDATGKQLLFDSLAIPAGGMPAMLLTTSDFTDNTQLSNMMPTADKRTVVWGEGITSLAFSANTTKTDARMVESIFTIDMNGQPATFRGSANTRASADYLFYSQTQSTAPIGSARKARKTVSLWNGYVDVVGTAQPVNVN